MSFDLALMQGVQALSLGEAPLMDMLFAAFTFLAEEKLLFLVVFAIYWGVDKRRGELLICSLFAAVALNGGLKDLVRRPRPFLTAGFEEARYVRMENLLVNTVHLKDSFSFPSGHSQCAGALYGALALEAKSRRGRLLCLVAVVLVMLSRVYLGVHFPTDVLLGALLGVASALLATVVFRKWYRYRLWFLGGAAALALVSLLQDYSIDTLKTTWLGVGCFLGMVAESRWVGFATDIPARRRWLRILVGLALAGTLLGALKLLLPAGEVFTGLRYGLLGLFAAGGWPLLFTKLKL